MENNDLLSDLVRQYVCIIFETAEVYGEQSSDKRYLEAPDYARMTTDEHFKVIVAILFTLGEAHPFRGAWEVSENIMDQVIARTLRSPQMFSEIANSLSP